MVFMVNRLADVIEILRQRPDWREKLRDWLLEEELRARKRAVAESTQGQMNATRSRLNKHASGWNETVNATEYKAP